MIDDITINFRSFENIVSMKNIRRKYNLTVDLSKFTLNKKKKKEWNCSVRLQPSLLPNFEYIFIYLYIYIYIYI